MNVPLTMAGADRHALILAIDSHINLYFQMWMSVKPAMEDATRHALTLMALLNVPVAQGTL